VHSELVFSEINCSPSVSVTVRGITSFSTSQLVCRAGLQFISSNQTCPKQPPHHNQDFSVYKVTNKLFS